MWREKFLNSFKSRLFSIKNLDKITTLEPKEPATEPEIASETTKATKMTKAKTKCKASSLKLHGDFLNKIKKKKI